MYMISRDKKAIVGQLERGPCMFFPRAVFFLGKFLSRAIFYLGQDIIVQCPAFSLVYDLPGMKKQLSGS